MAEIMPILLTAAVLMGYFIAGREVGGIFYHVQAFAEVVRKPLLLNFRLFYGALNSFSYSWARTMFEILLHKWLFRPAGWPIVVQALRQAMQVMAQNHQLVEFTSPAV